MHQSDEMDDAYIFVLDKDVLGGLLTAFPGWFRKMYNLLDKHGVTDLGKFYKSLRKDELEDMLMTFSKSNEGNLEPGKCAVLFTMLNMIAQGEGRLTQKTTHAANGKVVAMALAAYYDKNGQGKAQYDKYDLHSDIDNYYISNKKPSDPEVQVQK